MNPSFQLFNFQNQRHHDSTRIYAFITLAKSPTQTVKTEPLSAYPAGPLSRDMKGSFLVTGQVPGASAVHTATDIPLSAFGPGAYAFTGVMDNTDVFFKLAQAAVNGAVVSAGQMPAKRAFKRAP